MNDEFLTRFRAEPRPEFSSELRARLNRSDQRRHVPGSFGRWGTALAAASIVGVFGLLAILPGARAAAQDFLDLFRVKKFAAIAIDQDG